MAKIDVTPVTGGYNLSAINNNFRKIEDALNEGVLWRDNPDGEPNQLESDIDTNGQRIYNLPEPVADHEAARFKEIKDVRPLLADVVAQANRAVAAADASEDARDVSVAAANTSAAVEERLIELLAQTDVDEKLQIAVEAAEAAATLGNLEIGPALVGFPSFTSVPSVVNMVAGATDPLNAQAQALLDRQIVIANEVAPSIVRYGAAGGGANDTAAFAAARAATGGRYHIPKGTWNVDASPDIFADCFTAGDSAFVVIGGVTYDVSNAFAGALRYVTVSPVLTAIVHAKTGATIMAWQNGDPGTATYFYRGLAFETDSHFIQAKPKTPGGSTDLLLQRSAGNVDPNGNRFAMTFEEGGDLLSVSYATTATGLPNFDTAWAVKAGGAPTLDFPAIPGNFRQGVGVQTRAGGALKLFWEPVSDTIHQWIDKTTGSVLGYFTRSFARWAGVEFDTLRDTPAGIHNPKRWGGVWSDVTAPNLPVTVNVMNLPGANRHGLIGTLRVGASPSGAAGGWREARVTYDGATLTVTDVVPSTLPAGFTADFAIVGNDLQFSASYSGASGGGYTLCASFEWSYAGR